MLRCLREREHDLLECRAREDEEYLAQDQVRIPLLGLARADNRDAIHVGL